MREIHIYNLPKQIFRGMCKTSKSVMSCQESISILLRYIIKFHFLDVKKRENRPCREVSGPHVHTSCFVRPRASNVFPQNSRSDHVFDLSLLKSHESDMIQDPAEMYSCRV